MARSQPILLLADRCYVLDRGYAKFALFNAIHAAGSSYLHRIRDNSSYEVLQERVVSEEAEQADLRNDLLLPDALGRPRGVVGHLNKRKPHVLANTPNSEESAEQY